jgi:hypothetical protein
MKSEQRVTIWFLLKENANTDDIHRRFQAQFTDDAYSVRSVRRWCDSVGVRARRPPRGSEVGRSPIDFIDTKILLELNNEFFHSAHSVAEA